VRCGTANAAGFNAPLFWVILNRFKVRLLGNTPYWNFGGFAVTP